MNNIATQRILRRQPLPGDEYRLVVSPLRYANVGAYNNEAPFVQVYGNMNAVFCARLALCYVEHSWLDYHGLMLGIEVLAGDTDEAIVANARRAKAYYESYMYDPAQDMENIVVKGFVLSPFKDPRYYGE